MRHQRATPTSEGSAPVGFLKRQRAHASSASSRKKPLPLDPPLHAWRGGHSAPRGNTCRDPHPQPLSQSPKGRGEQDRRGEQEATPRRRACEPVSQPLCAAPSRWCSAQCTNGPLEGARWTHTFSRVLRWWLPRRCRRRSAVSLRRCSPAKQHPKSWGPSLRRGGLSATMPAEPRSSPPDAPSTIHTDVRGVSARWLSQTSALRWPAARRAGPLRARRRRRRLLRRRGSARPARPPGAGPSR
jgi:hypothetical protein